MKQLIYLCILTKQKLYFDMETFMHGIFLVQMRYIGSQIPEIH